MKKVCVLINPDKSKAKKIAENITLFLKKKKVEILGLDKVKRADFLIVVGGDGMILRAAQIVNSKIPVLAIAAGTLGFLSSMTSSQFKEKFHQIKRGKFSIENRMMLSAEVGKLKFKALNDFVVERKTHRGIELEVKIDNEELATYLGDGLIIATPTGSTAYSFAAGGPVVNPLISCLILTPVSAHTLMNRSFVLPDNESVKIFPRDDCFLTIDGQEKISVCKGVPITIKKAPFAFKLIKFSEEKFYNAVKSKLMVPKPYVYK